MQDFSESINAGNTVTQDIQLQPFTYEDMKKYKADDIATAEFLQV